jgi:type III secretory pathway component EscV
LSYRGRMAKGEPPEIYTITEAQRGLSVEQVNRQRRYLASMIIRTLCVVGFILVPGWPRALFIVAAIVLPYLAVVVANAGRENDEPGDVGAVEDHSLRALPAVTYELPSDRASEAGGRDSR